MQVFIAADVLPALADIVAKNNIRDILKYGFQGRHQLLMDETTQQACLALFPEDERDAWETILSGAARFQAQHEADQSLLVKIKARVESDWQELVLNLQDAARLLDMPLELLVENIENDGAFFWRWLASEDKERLQEAHDKGWFVVVHGGGTTLSVLLDERLQDQARAWRMFVLFDSDRVHPQEFEENWIGGHECHAWKYEKQMKDAERENQYWCLQRRFIESYLPLSVLREWAEGHTGERSDDLLKICIALDALRTEQLHFYNMKKGFAGDASFVGRQQALYKDLSVEIRQILESGFGKNVASIYKTRGPENPMPWDAEAQAEGQEMAKLLLRLL